MAASIRKPLSYTTQQTDVIIWTPDTDKRIIITDYMISIRNNTLGAITLSIFDDTDAPENWLYSAVFNANQNEVIPGSLTTEWVSGAVNRSLKITTTGALIVRGVISGYESI